MKTRLTTLELNILDILKNAKKELTVKEIGHRLHQRGIHYSRSWIREICHRFADGYVTYKNISNTVQALYGNSIPKNKRIRRSYTTPITFKYTIYNHLW